MYSDVQYEKAEGWSTGFSSLNCPELSTDLPPVASMLLNSAKSHDSPGFSGVYPTQIERNYIPQET